MEERVHTAGGEVMIWSKPGEGTTVLACVPAGAKAHTEEDMADGPIAAPSDDEAAAAPDLSRST